MSAGKPVETEQGFGEYLKDYLLDYLDPVAEPHYQEIAAELSPREEELQKAINGIYSSWGDEHASRPHNGLGVLDYDPSQFDEQSILKGKSDAYDPVAGIPDRLYYAGFKYKLIKALGFTTVRRLQNQIKQQTVSAEDKTPLITFLLNQQDEGKNTAVITPHVTLSELGFIKGLRFHAKKDRGKIQKLGTILNKLMTREIWRNKPMVQHFRPLGNVYWSSPKTESSLKWRMPTDAARLINANMLHPLLREDMEAGGMEIDFTPIGSEMKRRYDEHGRLIGYRFPPMDIASAALMTRFDNILPWVLLRDQANEWQMYIGDVIKVAELEGSKTKEEIVLQVFEEMRLGIENLTGLPVDYDFIGNLTEENLQAFRQQEYAIYP